MSELGALPWRAAVSVLSQGPFPSMLVLFTRAHAIDWKRSASVPLLYHAHAFVMPLNPPAKP
jgi:hypothetical protein